jgi:hypothetical protein
MEGIEQATTTGRIFPVWKVLKLPLDEVESVPGSERKYWTKLEGAFVAWKCVLRNKSRGDFRLRHIRSVTPIG